MSRPRYTPGCTSIFQRPSIEPSPSFDSPPTSRLDARTLSQTSASVIPPFLRLTPRRAISGRRMGPPEFIILDNFSSTRIASRDSPSSLLTRSSIARLRREINWIETRKFCFRRKFLKIGKKRGSVQDRFYRENRICKRKPIIFHTMINTFRIISRK